MTYMTSTASNNGMASINVFFEQGIDPDIAAVNVQNRVARATPLLPREVTQSGVATQKQQTSALMFLTALSKNEEYDAKFVQNYLDIHVLPELKRIKGVGEVNVFGAKTYAMRIWLDPDKLAYYDLMPSDVTAAINEQSLEAAAGALGQNDGQAFEYVIKYGGRYKTEQEYSDIIIKALGNGRFLRVGDDGHGPVLQRASHPFGLHVQQPGPAVRGVGAHARLGAGEAPGRDPQLLDGHRQQGHRDALACGEQHVQLALREVAGADLSGQVQQLVGGVTHGRDHDRHLVAGPVHGDDALGDASHRLGVGDRGAAELHHEQSHQDFPWVWGAGRRVGPALASHPGRRQSRCTRAAGLTWGKVSHVLRGQGAQGEPGGIPWAAWMTRIGSRC